MNTLKVIENEKGKFFILKEKLESSLAVQWLGLSAFTAVARVQFMIRELRSWKQYGAYLFGCCWDLFHSQRLLLPFEVSYLSTRQSQVLESLNGSAALSPAALRRRAPAGAWPTKHVLPRPLACCWDCCCWAGSHTLLMARHTCPQLSPTALQP